MTGIELIAAERKRQINEEGWTPTHDEMYMAGELALAVACYASPVPLYQWLIDVDKITFVDPWPGWDKRKRIPLTNELIRNEELPVAERIRNLEKAGALIAAEIDRLQRKQGVV